MDENGYNDSIYQDLYWPVNVTITVNDTAHTFEEGWDAKEGQYVKRLLFFRRGRGFRMFLVSNYRLKKFGMKMFINSLELKNHGCQPMLNILRVTTANF